MVRLETPDETQRAAGCSSRDARGCRTPTDAAANRLNAFMGDWSPDGTEIVFHLRGSDPDGPGVNQLFVLNVEGGGKPRQLTHMPHGSDPGHASWSPAG